MFKFERRGSTGYRLIYEALRLELPEEQRKVKKNIIFEAEMVAYTEESNKIDGSPRDLRVSRCDTDYASQNFGEYVA